MKRFYTMLLACLVILSTQAQSLVFEETFEDWYSGKMIQWNDDWTSTSNTNGWSATGDGRIQGFDWRGGIQTLNPYSNWAVGQSVVLTVDIDVQLLDAPIFDNRKFTLFGLVADGLNTNGQNNMAGETYNANTLGFEVQQSSWDDNGSLPNGTMRVFSYFGASNAEALLIDANKWGLDPNDIAAAGTPDIQSDVIRITYTATKTAVQDIFSIDVMVENVDTGDSWVLRNTQVENSTIYSASDVYFTAASEFGGNCMFIGNVKIESMTVAETLAMAKANLTLGDVSAVTEDIVLPLMQNGATVSWESSNLSVVANDGSVVQPSGSDAALTLTATIELDGLTETKTFEVIVKEGTATNLENKTKEAGINVYPNPVIDVLNITDVADGSVITIHSATGSIVSVIRAAGGLTQVDLSSQPTGVYLVKVADKVTRVLKK